MTEGVRPVSPTAPKDRRAVQRRTAERRGPERGSEQGAEAGASRDLVPVGEVVDHDPADGAASARRARSKTPGAASASASAFAAQMLGQGGQRNGLKGGPPVMDAARATYLNAEYSGEKDRRPPVGTAKRTDI